MEMEDKSESDNHNTTRDLYMDIVDISVDSLEKYAQDRLKDYNIVNAHIQSKPSS